MDGMSFYEIFGVSSAESSLDFHWLIHMSHRIHPPKLNQG